jgi:hypothetical protein
MFLNPNACVILILLPQSDFSPGFPLHPSRICVSHPLPVFQEFIQLAKRLVSDPALEKEIVTNGREYVRTHHSWQVERDTYQRLIRKLETNLED